jgi:hypothetical protein
MEGDAAAFKAQLLKVLEEEHISDADVREETAGECATVAAYVEKLVSEYLGGKKDE